MSSSRVLATDRNRNHCCDMCGYDGAVTEILDPEIPYAEWVCPECGTTYDITEPVFYAGPDPDYARELWLDQWN